MIRGSFAVVLAGVVLVGACGGDDLPKPATIEVSIGSGQQAPAGARLPIPLRVVVRGEDGGAFIRGGVRWRVTSGTGATLSDSITMSDALGRAEVVITLGPTAGTYTVSAALADRSGEQVTFTLTATEPPVLTAVSPDVFSAGESITVTGLRLRTGLTLLVDGIPATVGNVSPTGQGFAATVPRCLTPGDVDLQVIVNGGASNVISGTYEASGGTVNLGLGEYVMLGPERLAGCADFPPGAFNGSEYLLVVQAGTGERGVTAEFRLMGDSAAPVAVSPRTAAPDSLPFAVRFHDRLRADEAEFAKLPKPAAPPPVPRAPLAQIALGDRRDFRVCNQIGCSDVADFSEVTAVARYVGDNAAIFVDQAAPSGGLSDADIADLGSLFDNDLYELGSQTFGAESDVDQNGHTIILMTGVVNGLTPESQCETSIVTGFFFSIDIDPAFAGDVRSNRGEVFYTLVPDPQGTITCAHPLDRIRRLVPVTFIHEFQHMISYNQHVLLRGGGTEYTWLNEGLSHLAEELGGQYFLNLGDRTKFSQFVIGDLFDAYEYLTVPGENFLSYVNGQGTLAERGAAWLFMRWLTDQYGESLPRRLVETRLRGAENIESATGAPFDRLVAEWALANYVSDLPDFNTPVRVSFADWAFRTTYADLHEQNAERFPEPFPLIPMAISGGAFNVTGTLRAGSGHYFLVSLESSQAGFHVSLTEPDGSAFDAGVEPRLTVIRLR